MLSMLAAACAFEAEIAQASEKQKGSSGRRTPSPPPELPEDISPLRLHMLSSLHRESFQKSDNDKQRSLVCQELLQALRSSSEAPSSTIVDDPKKPAVMMDNLADAKAWQNLEDKLARKIVLDALRGKCLPSNSQNNSNIGGDCMSPVLFCNEDGVGHVKKEEMKLNIPITAPVGLQALAAGGLAAPQGGYPTVLVNNNAPLSAPGMNSIYLPGAQTLAASRFLASRQQDSSEAAVAYPIDTSPCTPTLSDVLCGRGAATNNHPGNLRFRALIGLHQKQYLAALNGEKADISRSVVRALRQLNPPGRFLKKDPKSGLWYDIGEDKATEKTSQAFREKKSSQNQASILNNIQKVQELVKTDVTTLQLPPVNEKKKKRKRASEFNDCDSSEGKPTIHFFPAEVIDGDSIHDGGSLSPNDVTEAV